MMWSASPGSSARSESPERGGVHAEFVFPWCRQCHLCFRARSVGFRHVVDRAKKLVCYVWSYFLCWLRSRTPKESKKYEARESGCFRAKPLGAHCRHSIRTGKRTRRCAFCDLLYDEQIIAPPPLKWFLSWSLTKASNAKYAGGQEEGAMMHMGEVTRGAFP